MAGEEERGRRGNSHFNFRGGEERRENRRHSLQLPERREGRVEDTHSNGRRGEKREERENEGHSL